MPSTIIRPVANNGGGDECFIGRAFDWSNTPEGYDYWLDIDNKWYNQNS